mgnify:CR=1 FL=1
MSIGIALAVPDGIALAADSQTTWTRTIVRAKDKDSGREFALAEPIIVPVGWSRMARKLFSVSIKGQCFAVVTAGNSLLNGKTMYAVFQSAAKMYDGEVDCSSVSRFFADYIRRELALHFKCKADELKDKPRTVYEFIIAGYEEQDVTRPFIESYMVFSGTIKVGGQPNNSGIWRRWANYEQNHRYHAAWVGEAAYIAHVVNHNNPALPPISGQYALMTLADAVDYTKFLVRFTCEFQRFAVVVPNCALPMISATLTPEGYNEEIVS